MHQSLFCNLVILMLVLQKNDIVTLQFLFSKVVLKFANIRTVMDRVEIVPAKVSLSFFTLKELGLHNAKKFAGSHDFVNSLQVGTCLKKLLRLSNAFVRTINCQILKKKCLLHPRITLLPLCIKDQTLLFAESRLFHTVTE